MEDKVSYRIDKDEINQQKMQLVVINRRPQYLQKPQEVAKREIAKKLNISRSTVQYRRTSSFEQLKKYLEENADEWIEW